METPSKNRPLSAGYRHHSHNELTLWETPPINTELLIQMRVKDGHICCAGNGACLFYQILIGALWGLTLSEHCNGCMEYEKRKTSQCRRYILSYSYVNKAIWFFVVFGVKHRFSGIRFKVSSVNFPEIIKYLWAFNLDSSGRLRFTITKYCIQQP